MSSAECVKVHNIMRHDHVLSFYNFVTRDNRPKCRCLINNDVANSGHNIPSTYIVESTGQLSA